MILAFYPADLSPVCGDQMALYNGTVGVHRSPLAKRCSGNNSNIKIGDDLWIACWWWFLTTKPKRFFDHQGANSWI